MGNKARMPVVMVSEIVLMALAGARRQEKKTMRSSKTGEKKEGSVFLFTDAITGYNANPKGSANIIMY